jgi:hypothetical protein
MLGPLLGAPEPAQRFSQELGPAVHRADRTGV